MQCRHHGKFNRKSLCCVQFQHRSVFGGHKHRKRHRTVLRAVGGREHLNWTRSGPCFRLRINIHRGKLQDQRFTFLLRQANDSILCFFLNNCWLILKSDVIVKVFEFLQVAGLHVRLSVLQLGLWQEHRHCPSLSTWIKQTLAGRI